MEENGQDRQALLDKIKDLMDYRMLPDLLAQVEPAEPARAQLLQRLTDLQVAIYDLDHYLETTWQLKEQEIDQLWQPIYQCLTVLDVPEDRQDAYVAHIKKYQKHEMQLRKLMLPTRLNMEYFYFYKSCDVKLLRKVMMQHYPALARMYPEADWRLFDLITEVDDDVEDVLEDRLTINGNRYLINIWQHGFEATQQVFLDFLDGIRERVEQRFGKKESPHQNNLLRWSQQVLEETTQRIKDTPEPDLSMPTLWLRGRIKAYSES